jgi:hypothetical protein
MSRIRKSRDRSELKMDFGVIPEDLAYITINLEISLTWIRLEVEVLWPK